MNNLHSTIFLSLIFLSCFSSCNKNADVNYYILQTDGHFSMTNQIFLDLKIDPIEGLSSISNFTLLPRKNKDIDIDSLKLSATFQLNDEYFDDRHLFWNDQSWVILSRRMHQVFQSAKVPNNYYSLEVKNKSGEYLGNLYAYQIPKEEGYVNYEESTYTTRTFNKNSFAEIQKLVISKEKKEIKIFKILEKQSLIIISEKLKEILDQQINAPLYFIPVEKYTNIRTFEPSLYRT